MHVIELAVSGHRCDSPLTAIWSHSERARSRVRPSDRPCDIGDMSPRDGEGRSTKSVRSSLPGRLGVQLSTAARTR